MRIIIFGTGAWYKKYKPMLADDTEVMALLDNNQALWDKSIDNVRVYNPEKIGEFEYDCVLLLSRYAEDMRKQLVGYGIAEDKMWEWEHYAKEGLKDAVSVYGEERTGSGKKAMFIVVGMGYDGSTMASVYAAQILVQAGYDVVMATAHIDSRLKQEILEYGIRIAVAPGLPYLEVDSKLYKNIERYDFVLVNTLLMIDCVCELSKIRPVVWWLHEAKMFYAKMLKEKKWLRDKINFFNVKIYAVSKIAQGNFKEYFPESNVELLPYGIPDECLGEKHISLHRKIIIALVGGIERRKAQDILLDAVGLLHEEERKEIEIWLIGKIPNVKNEYGRKICKMLVDKPEVKLMGVMDRNEITEAYGKIDVVVCPSREETMSIVLTEGMMHGKVCISSDASVVGMADYIKDEYNGLVFEHENASALAQKLRWVISHRESMGEMGKRARRTYEKYFSMEPFRERMLRIAGN